MINKQNIYASCEWKLRAPCEYAGAVLKGRLEFALWQTETKSDRISAAAERQVFERCKMPRMCLLLANAERNSRLDLPLERVTPLAVNPLLSDTQQRNAFPLFLLLLGESVKLIRKRERI